jgi:hypothetical protein
MGCAESSDEVAAADVSVPSFDAADFTNPMVVAATQSIYTRKKRVPPSTLRPDPQYRPTLSTSTESQHAHSTSFLTTESPSQSRSPIRTTHARRYAQRHIATDDEPSGSSSYQLDPRRSNSFDGPPSPSGSTAPALSPRQLRSPQMGDESRMDNLSDSHRKDATPSAPVSAVASPFVVELDDEADAHGASAGVMLLPSPAKQGIARSPMPTTPLNSELRCLSALRPAVTDSPPGSAPPKALRSTPRQVSFRPMSPCVSAQR